MPVLADEALKGVDLEGRNLSVGELQNQQENRRQRDQFSVSRICAFLDTKTNPLLKILGVDLLP
jgi:hypothetical protein